MTVALLIALLFAWLMRIVIGAGLWEVVLLCDIVGVCSYLLLLFYCLMLVVALRHVSVEQKNYLLTNNFIHRETLNKQETDKTMRKVAK